MSAVCKHLSLLKVDGLSCERERRYDEAIPVVINHTSMANKALYRALVTSNLVFLKLKVCLYTYILTVHGARVGKS